ncbi:MAG: right-handed parallel beta-helix repeat-containing protein, partial [Candidatus Subteraquimicrobiales bacterium]|nr:right-handed parallel beta-helix repeat-containing protein [Candidatus Subteraquimicrobiales bacterium]
MMYKKTIVVYFSIIISAILVLSACRPVLPTKIQRDFYVSPDGKDDGKGTKQKPFLTLNRAVDASRLVGEGQQRRIILRNGNYYNVHVRLVTEDAGLTIEAEDGETPVLYGGTDIVNWQKINEDLYVADVPKNLKENKSDIRVLIVNGQSRPRAKIPKQGRFTHLSSFNVSLKANADGGTSDGVWNRKPSKEELTTMIYQGDDLGPWIDINNAEFLIYHMWDVSIAKAKVLNENSRTITFEKPLSSPAGSFNIRDYIVFNVREGMVSPGQWYLDNTMGKIIYWRLPHEQMIETLAIIPTQDSVLQLVGNKQKPVRRITLRGLTIEGTTTSPVVGGWAAEPLEGAVTANFTEDCQFLNLSIKNVGGHGLKSSNCKRLLVSNCDLANIGGSGINLRGGYDSAITNNHIQNIGCLYPSGIGINLVRTIGSLISKNEINDTNYTAICCDKSNGAKLEYNLIYNYMKDLRDGGAIYVSDSKDVMIRRNVVKGANDNITSKHYIAAYYFDEKTENCTLEENLALNTRLPSLNHLAKGCVLRNNYFIDDGPILMKFARCKDFTLERNIIYSKFNIVLQAPPEAIAAIPNNIFFSGTR